MAAPFVGDIVNRKIWWGLYRAGWERRGRQSR